MGVQGAHSNTVALVGRLERLIAQLPSAPATPEESVPPEPEPQAPDILPKLPRDQVLVLVDAYRAGATVYQLATQFGIHRQTVSRILKRSGVTMRRRTLSAEEVAQLLQAHQQGDTIQNIAARYGIQPSTVRKRLEESGCGRQTGKGENLDRMGDVGFA